MNLPTDALYIFWTQSDMDYDVTEIEFEVKGLGCGD